MIITEKSTKFFASGIFFFFHRNLRTVSKFLSTRILVGKFLSILVSHMTRITDSFDDAQDLYWLVVILGLFASIIREM